MRPAPAIRTVGLDKVYGDKRVLAEVDLEIPRGERFCLVGRNGSGKSTLLEIWKGLKLPTRGEVEVLGRPPLDPELKSRCAMVMDRPVYPYYARVREVIWLYAGFYPHPADGERLMRRFELEPEIYVRHLSKGQLQRLGLLLALLGNPELLLLDEPTSGLDPQARVMIWEALGASIDHGAGRTLVFATHNLHEAERWAQRIAIVHRGRLVAIDTPERLLSKTIGCQRKVTLVGEAPALDAFSSAVQPNGGAVRSLARLGAETALYTDDPNEILRRLRLADERVEVRVENVTLRDAYFELTGETPDAHATLAG